MKLFLLALTVALAAATPDADADAYTLYGNTGIFGRSIYPGYSGYNTGLYKPYSGYTSGLYNPYFATRSIYNPYVKRDADADADADAYTLYNRGIFGSSIYPGYSTYNTGLYKPYSAYTSGLYNPYVATRSIYNPYVKRDADAESDADAYTLYNRGIFGSSIYPGYSGYNAGLYKPYSAYTSGLYNPYFATRSVYNPYVKRDADADADSDPALVAKFGNFHTNVANLNKGIHTQYAHTAPAQVYNAPTPFYGQRSYTAYNPYTARTTYGFPGYYGF